MAQPVCPYFGKCGGCSAQHIDYTVQVDNKKKILQRISGLEEVEVHTGEPYFYRNRMDMIFHPGGLGFREKGNWKHIIDIEQCAIADKRINSFIRELRDHFRNADVFDIIRQSGTFKQAVIRTPQNDSSISFVLNEKSTRIAEAVEQIRDFAANSSASNVAVTYIDPRSEVSVSDNFFMVKGADVLTETFLGTKFKYSIQGFFQNNSAVAEEMLGYVHSLLKKYDTRDADLLDLYGGVGVFGLTNAALFRRVSIVEGFKPAADAATRNILENNIRNAEAHALDAEKIGRLRFASRLLAVNDPPRSGMAQKAVQKLMELAPEVVIYISCNPEQLSKDIPKFKKYKVKSAALFDLFPQTPHMESVVEMVRA